MATNTVAKATGTQSKYALDATVLGGHEVQTVEGEGSCTEGVPTKVTKVETLGMAKEHKSPREAEVLKHLQLPQPMEHTNRSAPDQRDSAEAASHMQGGPVEPLQVSGPKAELMVHQKGFA